jgi:photosystem II stability/assembly factor-like uncharacterized protein
MRYYLTNCTMKRLFLISAIIIIGLSASLKSQPALDTLGNFWNLSSGTSVSDIRTVSIDSSGFIYLGVWDIGIKRSTDAGSTWIDITNNLSHKNITAIEFDSTGKIYVATYGGGIFVSVNNGNNWSPVSNGILDQRITSLKIKRGGPMIAGTKSQGIYRSLDGGQSWTQVNTGLNIWEITALHISRNGFILAGTSSWGVYRSEDQGITWKRSNGSLTNKNVTSFAQNSIGEIICGTLGGGVNFSVDNGASWSEFLKSDKCVNVTSVVWASNTSPIAGLNDKGIVKYDDRIMDDWILTSFRLSGVPSMAKSSNGTLWAALPFYGLYKSTNLGSNWTVSYGAAPMGATAKTFAFKNGIVLSTTDAGGLQRSTDNGISWISGGMSGLGISAAALDSLGNLLLATYTKTGASAGTLYKSSDGGANWTSIFSKRDTIITAIAVNPQGILFTALKFPPKDPKNPDAITSELYMSSDSGINWNHIVATADIDGFKFIGINLNGDVYIFQKWGLYRSINNGTDWVWVFSSETAVVSSIGFSSTRAIYAGTNLGIFKSADHGVNWTTYDFGMTYPNVSYVIVSPFNQIFAALSYSGGIVVSNDAGRSWQFLNRGTTAAPVQTFSQSRDGFLFFTTSAIFRAIEPNSLPAPAQQTPAHNAEGVSLFATFTWDVAPKADMYEFQVSTDPDFYSIKDYTTTGATSYTLKYKLESSSLHYWRVRSRSNNSLGAWSPVRVFVSILDKPELIDPPNNSGSITTLGPILRWHKLKGSSVYTVQVSIDPAFSTTIYSKDIATDTVAKTGNLQLYTKYYWRVAGKSSKAQGPWSDVWMFTTKLKPVTLKSPANATTGLPNQVLMIWNLSDGANKYEVQIARDSLFSQMVFEGLADKNDRHLSKILENFTKYWWRIKALDDIGSSDWSVAWSFTTVIAAPELISPEDASKDASIATTFRWKDYNAASNYHIQVALDNSFTELILNDSTLLVNKIDVEKLDFFTKYRWRVRLYSSSTPGLWSTIWSFSTGIAQVKLVSPDNNAIDMPLDMTFIWDAVKGADTYVFQLSKNIDFSPVLTESEVSDTKKEIPALDPLTKYYFRVKAKYADGEGELSEIRSFTTKMSSGLTDAIPGMSDLFLYPNPFSENLSVSFSLENDANVTIEILDMKGVSVYRSDYGIITSGNQMLSISPAGLTQGSYTLNLMINGKSITRMINLVK